MGLCAAYPFRGVGFSISENIVMISALIVTVIGVESEKVNSNEFFTGIGESDGGLWYPGYSASSK